MLKPRNVLRPLILIFLSGWVGIAAPPAEAQQPVTLSGQVTDAAGNAVSGVHVVLFRLPGWIWIDGQNTDANGAYRFSGPPGTYILQVQPQSPFIAQEIELALSTNTTRNFVLESGVTLSGQVTGPTGQPVPWAWVSVHNDEGLISFGGANESGHYSLGVPAGTYQIDVSSDDFVNPMLEGVAVPHDTVLNITLESGVLLAGQVVDEVGQPVQGAQVCAYLPTEDQWFCTDTEPAGSFQLRVAPDAGYIVTVRPMVPLRQTQFRLEIGREEMSDLVLTVSRDPTPFVPDDPPKAALISISPPTADGEATLHGAAGAVAPHSAVVAITLETGHFTTAQATADGSFTATLFAPAGTSVLIKADPVGRSVVQLLVRDPDEDRDSSIAALPGTILRVADPLGTGIPIGGAGRTKWGTETASRPGPSTAPPIPRPSPLAIPCRSRARCGWSLRPYRALMRSRLRPISDLSAPMGRVSSTRPLLPPSSPPPGC